MFAPAAAGGGCQGRQGRLAPCLFPRSPGVDRVEGGTFPVNLCRLHSGHIL
jgi:hypothetical protein